MVNGRHNPRRISPTRLFLRARPLVEYSHILSRLLTRHAGLSVVLGVELALSRYSWKTAKSERERESRGEGGREEKESEREGECCGDGDDGGCCATAALSIVQMISRERRKMVNARRARTVVSCG